jgi:PST family polysaccharide transporter
MNGRSTYRQILRSSSIIGGASVVNILIGLLRSKVAALLLGPTGVGLIGLFQSIMSTAATISALGLSSVGTRQIAEAESRNDSKAIAIARRALFWGTLMLAAAGGAVFWIVRGFIARYVVGDPTLAGDIGCLSLGVALTVAAGSQSALLAGMRRVRDIACVSVFSAVASTTLGGGAIWLLGHDGLIAFVLSAPLATFLVGHLFVARLPEFQTVHIPFLLLAAEWRRFANLGIAFMLGGMVVASGQLIVRAQIQHQLGTEALGYFEAAWTMSMTYVGFVLTAMSTDYYPRLAASIRDLPTVNRIVNEQTEVALLLAGPAFLAILALAPWIVEALYSRQFEMAAQLLRWQILGDVLKIASWPIGFINLASGNGRAFVFTQVVAMCLFAGLTWLGLPWLGIQASGVAFLSMYIVHLPLLYLLGRRRTGFAWQKRVMTQLAIVIALALVTFLSAIWSTWTAAIIGLLAALILGAHGLARLIHIMSIPSED